jgi:hypothetical protein
MILSPADAKDFFRLIHGLDAWFQSRLSLPGNSLEEIRRLREAAFEDPAHVQDYVAENPDRLSQADLDTILAWQEYGFAARFLVYKFRKDDHLFSHHTEQSDWHLYQVMGLTQSITELVPFFPCYVETRLLPFRGGIVTDGLVAPVMIHFSSRMAKRFQNEVKEHIASHGAITRLPASAHLSAADESALLKHYLSTAANRSDYAEEIHDLRRKSAALNVQYLQHAGKLQCKSAKASLAASGITGGYFAVLGDTIITGASTKTAAAAAAAELVPPDLREAIVWLKL